MADSIPAALKQADINLFKCATKAVQLQTVKPIIAYWCEYWVVNQILARGLHSTSEEILQYTTGLMDKLEQTKAEYENEDAIIDDTAGQAYVEQFAQETLDRAERVVKANKVTQQTATTFDAAATFFHLVNIWGEPDAETQQKIKYAKWNAMRIAKAIKEGANPNESNPKPQEVKPEPDLDPNDPDVQMLGGAPSGTVPHPATVEDMPDAEVQRDAAGVSLPQSPASAGPSPSLNGDLRLPGVPTQLAPPASHPAFHDSESLPSPISPPTLDYRDPPELPHVPSGWGNAPEIPSAPTGWPGNPAPAPDWGQPPHQPSAPAPPPTFATSPPATAAVVSPPVDHSINSYYTNAPPTAHSAVHATPPVAPRASYIPAPPPASVDEAAIAAAQKHAKWAISALNFEDVNTAVRELRKALEKLGAT